MARIGRGRGQPVLRQNNESGQFQQNRPSEPIPQSSTASDSGFGTFAPSYPRGAATVTSSRPDDVAIQDITAAPTFSQGPNAIPRIDYNHKMPKGGDQGQKPTSEKTWPDQWHDPNFTGPSPFSESGRFEVMKNGSQILKKKKNKFSFSNKVKIEDHDAKEAEQHLARNLQLQAPPRRLPDYVYTDFMTKGRNVNQLLNEFCQHRRKTIEFKEVASNESFKSYGISAVIDGKTYPPGCAWKKQLAKEAASKNALKVLLLEYYRSVNETERVRNIEEMDEDDEKISRDVDHPTRYKEQAKLTTSKVDYRMLEARKIHKDYANEVVSQVMKTCDKLNIKAYKSQFAAFVLIYRGRLCHIEPKVVAIGTGENIPCVLESNFCRKPEPSDMPGRIIKDTSAMVIARRGFIRFLLDRAEKFYEKQKQTTFDKCESIFRMEPELKKLILDDDIEIVLYLSGNIVHGNLRERRDTKLDELPRSMVHHSTDKLAKWCTTGVQGAIGARVMEPIYISSIMIGTNDAYDVQGVKLQNYLNRVLSDNMLQQSGYLAGCYMCFRPTVYTFDTKALKENKSGFMLQPNSNETVSLEWDAMYNPKPDHVKKIRHEDGYEILIDKDTKKLIKRASRLTKIALFTVYKRVLQQRGLGGEDTEITYYKTKRQARNYQKCKKWLYNRWLVEGEGQWIRNPEADIIEQKIFVKKDKPIRR